MSLFVPAWRASRHRSSVLATTTTPHNPLSQVPLTFLPFFILFALFQRLNQPTHSPSLQDNQFNLHSDHLNSHGYADVSPLKFLSCKQLNVSFSVTNPLCAPSSRQMKGVVVGDGAVGKARRFHSPDPMTYERLKTDMSSYFLYHQCLPRMSHANFFRPPQTYTSYTRGNTSQQASPYLFVRVSVPLKVSLPQFLTIIRPMSWWMARQFLSDFGILPARRIMIAFDHCPILKPTSFLYAFLL
jgi:hypothetical protein